ncbi:uncharacterized protein LOC113475298 [Ciona intestinalis]
MDVAFMKPSDIRFSKEFIPARFSNRDEINGVIAKLTLHPKLLNTIPMIVVSNRNTGEWHSQNNRRLYMFRVLERNGILDQIQVEISNRIIVPFTRDDGCHVIMLGQSKALKHCDCKLIVMS